MVSSCSCTCFSFGPTSSAISRRMYRAQSPSPTMMPDIDPTRKINISSHRLSQGPDCRPDAGNYLGPWPLSSKDLRMRQAEIRASELIVIRELFELFERLEQRCVATPSPFAVSSLV